MIEHHNRPYYCIYKVKENSKIYVINAYEDFIRLIVKYPLKRDFNINIDFEKAGTEWDGIYLTSKGFQDCLEPRKEILKRYFKDENIQPTLKSWSIPSFLVFNPNSLTLLEEKENEHYIEID
ncbi:hypothetical protein C0971_01985 [Bacillus methanolicus]|uniref:hypothetical protein n=1 Tax=Bacillus methanolicus TaxID=1471 RepID=UPI00200E180D|nr:hypothetical protein [Bacillus methanolicus]UQD50948.1 hypothetical protein C0971_01985 [Bacillus methanolicus]